MLRFKFLIYIFVLYGFIRVNCGKTQKNKANVIVYFEKAKCANSSCCDDFQNLPGGAVWKEVDMEGKEMDPECSCEFPDIKHIPARTFQEKHIQRTVIQDPDVTVDCYVLEGINALGEFIVERSSIKSIPDFRFVKDSISEIKIKSSLLTALEGENLQNLTMINYLSFSNNSIRTIDPNVFKGTMNIRVLNLSYNQLTFIPETLLEPMKNLSGFLAHYNNLLHVNDVFTVTRPLMIYLWNNNITDISSALQFNFEKDEMWKRGRMSKCHDEKFHRPPYRPLHSIRRLDLSRNSINETSQSIFPCLRRFLHHRSFVLEIHHFKLNENNLKNFNFLLRYLIINILEVSENQIEYLTDEDFKYTTGIVNLELESNKIQRIDNETFRSLRSHLQYLHLSWNRITSLNGSMRFLINLKILSLEKNSIQSFATDEFLGLGELTILNVAHNQIKSIEFLQQLHRLQRLDIRDNDVELVRPDLVTETLRYIHIADNPIKCNCLFHLFIRQLNASSVQNDIHTICSKHVSAVSALKKFNSGDLCAYRCTQYKNDSYIYVDCSSRNLTVVPQFPVNNFANVEIPVSALLPTYIKVAYYHKFIENITSYTFHIEDKILGISLENNSLQSLDTVHLPPNLIQLYLHENKLRSLPKSILENQQNLKQATFSGNPWKCDCDAIKFKKWLTSEKEKVKDIDNVRCGIINNEASRLKGRVLTNLTDLEICPTDIALIVLAPSGALTFIIVCLVSKILYTKYKLNIKVFFYSYDIIFFGKEDIDCSKTFDAFISFSHNDDEFVIKEIISVIEKRNPNTQLCFHIRDFMPGELILANITRAVQNSKKTVLILSRNFLESEWCLLEARTAHSQAMEDKVHRIVVIKVGDLPKEIDPLIKAYLASTTYITWEESNFWDKLLYVLPSHVSDRGNILDSMEDNETVL